MALRAPTNWSDLKQTLHELFAFKDQYTATNLDFHGRRIKNASPSEDDLDYVVRKELKDFIDAGISSPPVVPRGSGSGANTFDKITFGIGVGAAVSIGDDLTPPYIWSNSANGKPSIIMMAANIPPEGTDLIIDIKKNGSTILVDGAFTFPAGTGAGVVVSSVTAFQPGVVFTRGAVLSIGTTQIGTDEPGQQISVVVFCKLT